MSLTGTQIARRAGATIELRTQPQRLCLRLSELTTADSHLLDLTFTCTICALDERGEREMFAETFLSSRDAVGIDEIASHFAPALKQAAQSVAKTQAAGEWMNEIHRKPILDAICDEAKRVAFACGVEVLPPFALEANSGTLRREQLETIERKAAERRHAGQVEHVQRAGELLRQFAALRETMPGLSAGRVLERVSAADRGSMLESLLMAQANDATETLFAVAGPNLVRIDPRTSPANVSILPLPANLGPLRSVQRGSSALLVGAQTGVLVVDPARPAEAIMLRDPDVVSPLGFNSVAQSGEMIWASHGDAGVVAWHLSQPGEPARAIRGAQQARNVVQLDESRVLYSTGGQALVARASADSTPQPAGAAGAAIVLIHVDRDAIALVRNDGSIDRLDPATLEQLDSQRRGGEIVSAGTLPWLGTFRLLLAGGDGPVICAGGDDPLVTHYSSPHRGLRAVAACADVVAALSADRQRIVLWNAWDGAKPLAEVHIASVARHRAADICFA